MFWIDLFSNNNMMILLIIILSIISILLFKAQNKNDSFDLRSVITDEFNRVSLSKLGQLFALLVSTWGFIVLVHNDKLTEWYFTSYMAIWTISEGFRKWNINKNTT